MPPFVVRDPTLKCISAHYDSHLVDHGNAYWQWLYTRLILHLI